MTWTNAYETSCQLRKEAEARKAAMIAFREKEAREANEAFEAREKAAQQELDAIKAKYGEIDIMDLFFGNYEV
jgi:hypothetical protein